MEKHKVPLRSVKISGEPRSWVSHHQGYKVS